MSEKRWSGIIAVEGRPTTDGRVIERNALVFPKGQIALIDSGAQRLVGAVDKIVRDGDLIRAEGILSLDPIGLYLGIQADSVKWRKRSGPMLIMESGGIRAVYVQTAACWPEARLDG